MNAFVHLAVTAGLLAGLVLGFQVIAAARGSYAAPGPTLISPSDDEPIGATIQWAHGDRDWRWGGRGWRGGGGWSEGRRWRGDWGRGWGGGWGWRGYDRDDWWRWHRHRHWEPDGDEIYFYSPYGTFGLDLD